MKRNENRHDDLTVIAGIGSVRQQWLNEALDVHTFVDLAILSADEIAEKLASDGKPFSYEEVKGWIFEAKEHGLLYIQEVFGVGTFTDLAALSTDEIRAKLRAARKPYSRNEVDYWLQKAKELASKWEPSNNPHEDWQRIAFVQVEYQRGRRGSAVKQRTLIYLYDKEENILVGDEWSQIETQQIGRWINEKAGEMLQQKAQNVAKIEPKPEAPTPASLDILGIRLRQLTKTVIAEVNRKSRHPRVGVVQASLPFSVETYFEMAEAANNGKLEIPYRAQFFVQKQGTGQKTHLGDAEPGLITGDKAASAILEQTTLPANLPPGRYQLQALVTAEQKDMSPGFFEMPLKVVHQVNRPSLKRAQVTTQKI